MPECEICGRETEVLFEVSVEGAVMLACEKCSRGKKVLRKIGEMPEERRPAYTIQKAEAQDELELVDDFGDRIRKAREKLGLPLRVLAEKISEKESMLVRIEKQSLMPSEKVAKKLEKELGIRLSAPRDKGGSVPGGKGSEAVSLWDAAEKKGDK